MKDSILLTKSKAFALRVVRLYKYLRERKESVIAKQMLRAGTSLNWREYCRKPLCAEQDRFCIKAPDRAQGSGRDRVLA